ncbi:MAG: 16S rRNA (adenine(1518)-N(6)/adenine(1519)-N(6))-dimethyltransferase RsmA [Candidatus Taylorbacteria bacterium]|nr:16S rRNA (adenine(1518)-N(6)/adenine(1519)-N(6))-dimethyltransferase RsmA [Candidatus Taylorbacteria bacterium]
MIFAKKSLGQNFLHDAGALHDIALAGNISAGDTVLEIGPGEGALTSELLKSAKKVVVVEKDDRLIPILEKKFAKEKAEGKFILIHGDILEKNPGGLGLKRGEYKVIANIPYYITGEVTRMFLESEDYPSTVVFLVQKEVAERMVDEKESILSISVKVYGSPKYIRTVKSGSFRPAPSVDSAVIGIYNISKKIFEDNKINEEDFFDIVKTGFSHKRKKLISNLAEFYDQKDLENIWSLLNLDINTRAETVKLETWVKIASNLFKII